jgi:DHA2 family multidrug resistance protein-like MFS transporter
MIGASCFGAVSILAAISTTPAMLIARRALMGIAGATLAPSTLSLIFNMFPDPRQRSIAIGWWIASFSAGSAVGPVLGGLLLEYFWWGSVFLLALPVMALLLILGPRVLPEYRDPGAGRLDVLSAALSLVSILAVIFGLKDIAQDGLSATSLAAIIGGLVMGALFIRRQRRLADPLIDVRLFQIRSFKVSLATNVMTIFVMVGYFLFVAQYLQLVLDLSPLQAGLWSLPSAAGFIIGSTQSSRFVHRLPPARVIGVSLVVSALGLAMLTLVGNDSGLAVIVAGSVVISLALSPVFNLTTELIVGSAPPEKAGSASGISETGAEFGGSMGIALLGSIGVAVYRRGVAMALPAGTDPALADAALDTLGGAVEVASQIGGASGASLLDAARQAFTSGLRLTAAISAVLAFGVALISSALLRGLPPGFGADSDRPVEELAT